MDRLAATRLAEPIVRVLEGLVAGLKAEALCVGLIHDQVKFTPLRDALSTLDPKVRPHILYDVCVGR